MNTEPFKQILLKKERDLVSQVAYLAGEAASPGETQVDDLVDDAAVVQAAAESSDQDLVVSQMLAQVRDALRRIEGGSYGRCVICGRPIEAARLEAVPWTPYCLKDQQKRDKAPHGEPGSTA